MNALALGDALLRDAAALLVVKVSVVLLVAGGVAAAARALSAAKRHMLWLVALSSCVWLVLSSSVFPAITIHAPALAPPVSPPLPREISVVPRRPVTATIVNERVSELATTQPAARPTPLAMSSPRRALIASWIAGCLALLAYYAMGLIGVRRLARDASIPRDAETLGELAGAAAAVGLRRPLRLGYSAAVASPITLGIAQPIVLLPADAVSWSASRRRAVLVHEAAHVARRDGVAQAIGRLACAAFWFHPLVWRSFAALRNDAERAADDCVLNAGMTSVEYASHLLDLARRVNDRRLDFVAVGIVSPNRLEERFMSIFDNTRSRAGVTGRWQAATTACALVAIGPLAAIRVQPPVARSHVTMHQAATPEVAPRRAGVGGEASAPVVGYAAQVGVVAPDLPLPPIALVGRALRAPVAVARATRPAPVHPNFSGKWRSDTVAVHSAEFVYLVTDSTTITQTDSAISYDGHGHLVTAPWPQRLLPTRNRFDFIRFDGVPTMGYTITGTTPTDVSAAAVWAGDTLVLTTDAEGGGQVLHTIERFRISPDGQTLAITNVSFVNGHDRWGTRTVLLRRLNP